MQFPTRDLTNQYISLSYQDVVQRYTQNTASYLLDGLGNVIGFVPITSLGQQLLTADQPFPPSVSASHANIADSALLSLESVFCDTASIATYSDYAGSSSYAVSASHLIGGAEISSSIS